MEAVRVENFAIPDWRGELYQRLGRRYPSARIEQRSAQVALVRLNWGGVWGENDEAFWGALKEQGIIQRWEPLAQVPPAPKHNKAIFEDIGYRIGSGERLTTKQQETLLTQLHTLEERALAAELQAADQHVRANEAEEHEKRLIARHNTMVDLLSIFNDALEIRVHGDIDEPVIVEDTGTGRVLARNVSLAEAYRTALRHRLREGKP